MSVVSGIETGGFLTQERDDGRPWSLEETYWGYIVRARSERPVGLMLGQAVAWFCGIAFVVAALGLWVMPMAALAGDMIAIKFGVSTVFFGFAAMLLWFASRGTEAELQVDTALGEVREVVRNRAGKPTLIGRYGFDSIGGVFIDRLGAADRLPSGHAVLVLRYGNTAQTLPVAAGSESALAQLRDRLGRDLMVRGRAAARADLAA